MGSPVTITVDLGFGDAGKGSVVDYLSRPGTDVAAVVRYNGGPQAAHRVVRPDGREHVFSQFGAGTFHPDVRTHLGPRVLVNPMNLMLEEEHLRNTDVYDALGRLTIDSECVLVTPYHVAANRIRELLRGGDRHGSCGQGIGEARADELAGLSVRAGDACSPGLLLERLDAIRRRKEAEIRPLLRATRAATVSSAIRREFHLLGDFRLSAWLADRYEEILRPLVVWGRGQVRELLERGPVVFEGAQGVLLDETYGFHPYTTWTDTTTRPALEILDDAGYDGPVERLGIVRAYQTRHGPGPLPTESEALTAALPDETNGTGFWQGPFRVGWLDAPLLRYALEATGGVDAVAVTCLDRAASLGGIWHVAVAYDGPDPTVDPTRDAVEAGRVLAARLGRTRPTYASVEPTAAAYADLLRDVAGVPVVLASHGPTVADKTELAWAAS